MYEQSDNVDLRRPATPVAYPRQASACVRRPCVHDVCIRHFVLYPPFQKQHSGVVVDVDVVVGVGVVSVLLLLLLLLDILAELDH